MKPVQNCSCLKNVLGIPCQINDDSLGLVDAQSMASPFFPKCIFFPFLNPKQLCPSLVYSISGHKTGLWICFLARGHKCVCVCMLPRDGSGLGKCPGAECDPYKCPGADLLQVVSYLPASVEKGAITGNLRFKKIRVLPKLLQETVSFVEDTFDLTTGTRQ